MSKKIKEFVTYWGPSVADWSDTEKRFVIERDETILNDAFYDLATTAGQTAWQGSSREEILARFDRHVVEARALIAHPALTAGPPQTWADLGCGDGTFTVALASQLPDGSVVHAMDTDVRSLRDIPPSRPSVEVVTHTSDFTEFPWPFADLDGVLMANSLHYVREQARFVQRWSERLAPRGRFLVVEYDTDAANRWVPFPISRARLPTVFERVGAMSIQDVGRRPSTYQRAPLYAVSIRPVTEND